MGAWLLYAATLIATLSSLSYVLLMLPPEDTQGFAQKIFFFHVPAAFAMYGCLIVGFFASIVFLFDRKKILYDQIARAALYTATIFSFVVIGSGPIWAKPIWGVYWTWDPRLTLTFIIFILLVAYCFVRRIFSEREGTSDRGAIIGAIIAILAVINIPLVRYSVQLWRGIHPSVIRNPEGLPDNFRSGLEFMTLSLFLLAGLITWTWFRIIRLNEKLDIEEKKRTYG